MTPDHHPTFSEQLEAYGARHIQHDHGHDHSHDVPSLWTVRGSPAAWDPGGEGSFVTLGLAALVRAIVVALTGSAAPLSETIHNVFDAVTAVPLCVAFSHRRQRSSYTYGTNVLRISRDSS